MRTPPKNPNNVKELPPQTLKELCHELETLIEQGYGNEPLRLQIGDHRNDDITAERVRKFTFGGKTKIYLVF